MAILGLKYGHQEEASLKKVKVPKWVLDCLPWPFGFANPNNNNDKMGSSFPGKLTSYMIWGLLPGFIRLGK
jgi:hypothetical protein